MASEAASTACTMLWYPVQRQRWPSRPRRTSRSVVLGFSSRNDTTAMTMPAVQKPHWRAWFSWKAVCTGCSSFADGARPSMVVIDAPSAWAANIVHDFTDSPSSRIVQAPHDDVSQPILVPVRPQSSRRYCTRSVRGSTSWDCDEPFTVIETCTCSPLDARPRPDAIRGASELSLDVLREEVVVLGVPVDELGYEPAGRDDATVVRADVVERGLDELGAEPVG